MNFARQDEVVDTSSKRACPWSICVEEVRVLRLPLRKKSGFDVLRKSGTNVLGATQVLRELKEGPRGEHTCQLARRGKSCLVCATFEHASGPLPQSCAGMHATSKLLFSPAELGSKSVKSSLSGVSTRPLARANCLLSLRPCNLPVARGGGPFAWHSSTERQAREAANLCCRQYGTTLSACPTAIPRPAVVNGYREPPALRMHGE